jgi:hypothetical protein
MACFLPFRPWLYPGLRVFRFRTTRDQSTDPTHVLSCPYAPPQWLAPTLVAPHVRPGRPCPPHETPRMHPRPFSIPGPGNPFLRPAFDRAFDRPCRTDRKSRLQGLATLLAASAPRPTEACFSFPRSWASLSRALVRSRDRFPVSRKPSAPALSCQTVRPDTGASAVYVRDISGTHRLSHPFRVKAGTLPS